jgi:hypothetical protein
MTSFPEGAILVTSASSGDGGIHHANRIAHRGFDPRLLQPVGTPEAATLNRAEQDLVVTTKTPPRILLVDAALALLESHLLLVRSIPAIVETLASFADMYLHEERGYALVILALHPKSRESSEAAHFVRHRWSTARILLLASEPAMIDDWLYDDRIDPHLDPATICEAAIRLLA